MLDPYIVAKRIGVALTAAEKAMQASRAPGYRAIAKDFLDTAATAATFSLGFSIAVWRVRRGELATANSDPRPPPIFLVIPRGAIPAHVAAR